MRAAAVAVWSGVGDVDAAGFARPERPHLKISVGARRGEAARARDPGNGR